MMVSGRSSVVAVRTERFLVAEAVGEVGRTEEGVRRTWWDVGEELLIENLDLEVGEAMRFWISARVVERAESWGRSSWNGC
jgi:hypothetical protein